MPFPAISWPVSFAIGIPISLAAFATQEAVLRRRASSRQPAQARTRQARAVAKPPKAADVTAPDPAATAKPMESPRRRPAAAPARPARKAAEPTSSRGATKQAAKGTAAATRPRPARRDPAPALRKRVESLRKGLEAVIAFVDGPPRRAQATACADALLLAVPRSDRGPAIEAYLRAAGAREGPTALQELAEEAGIEIATAMKQVNAELKARA